jgi:hypothetical protein
LVVVTARDTLIAETTSALGIVGLLLVFLPLFLDAVSRGKGGSVPWRKLQLLRARSWIVAATVAIGAADATSGLVTLWGTFDLAKLTAILLLVLVWAVVALAVLATAGAR